MSQVTPLPVPSETQIWVSWVLALIALVAIVALAVAGMVVLASAV